MDQNRIKRNQMLGAKIVKELTARNMEAYYTDSKEEALKKALELIPEGSSISWGGSMSVSFAAVVASILPRISALCCVPIFMRMSATSPRLSVIVSKMLAAS